MLELDDNESGPKDNKAQQGETVQVDAREYVAKLVNEKKYDKAEPILLKIISAQPDNIWALTALGIVYRSTKRYVAAESCYRRAVQINPENPEVHSNFGNLLVDMDKFDEAVQHSERAVELKPDVYLFRKNLAVTYRETKHHKKALEQYQWCLKHKPEDPDLNFDIAYISLYCRDLDTAWDYFEWRFQTKKLRIPEGFNLPKWDGTPLKDDKRLLVLAEQGFGDTILMTRFFKRLKEDCYDITFSCKDPLHALFADLPVKLIDERNIKQNEYDCYIAAMSLPILYEKDWMKWPEAAKMVVPTESKEKYKWMPKHSEGKLKVGVIWSGSVTFGGNEKRAVTLDPFLELAAKFPNIQFYSFQKGPREIDFKENGTGTIVPLGQSFENFSETAAALEHMDVVVMTDSAVVHLSGCLGVPVMDLLQFMPYWLYFPENTDTPLYKSLRFVRQKIPGDWDTVFSHASNMLEKMSSEREEKPISRERVLAIMDEYLEQT